MNRIGRLENGQVFTSGEKALVVMLIAGVFGYWAGFNLSTPGDAAVMPLAAAASMPLTAQTAGAVIAPAVSKSTLDRQPLTVSVTTTGATPVPTF